ncbi:hypothetical protein GUJ93_ZPchr0002g23144 [Zizania palustris]|uniref:Uncharacterized protein n=1 Tax=Zizania palustris TaxID=103762 RepID=A0A8J5RVM1_ZIZPA|nr:hypothetical protein GUJ93_ZPchr0002g23144 [Zizania palustris]
MAVVSTPAFLLVILHDSGGGEKRAVGGRVKRETGGRGKVGGGGRQEKRAAVGRAKRSRGGGFQRAWSKGNGATRFDFLGGKRMVSNLRGIFPF